MVFDQKLHHLAATIISLSFGQLLIGQQDSFFIVSWPKGFWPNGFGPKASFGQLLIG
jgi:hypothetical protein